jgi:hypothetical protein
MGAPRALNPEAVAEAARRAAGKAAATPAAKEVQQLSYQRLQAKNATRNIGNPAGTTGNFGGAKPGALDPTAVKNTRMAVVDKGSGGQFSADDVRFEVVSLSADHHAICLLGSSGLYRGATPLELAVAAAAHPRDCAAASMASAQLAHKHTVKKSTDDACWVQAEKLHGFEITCVAMRMVWNEPLVQKPEPTQRLAALLQKPDSGMTAAEMAKVVNSAPESLLLEVAKQMADEEDATRKREDSAGSKLESARKRAKTLEEKGPDDAIGPQLPGMEHVAIERAPDDAEAFDMDYLDSTSRWRVKLAGAEYMRGGPQEQLESEKRKGKDGKGKGGGKGGGKGKGKGKGKKGKGKKGKKRQRKIRQRKRERQDGRRCRWRVW